MSSSQKFLSSFMSFLVSFFRFSFRSRFRFIFFSRFRDFRFRFRFNFVEKRNSVYSLFVFRFRGQESLGGVRRFSFFGFFFISFSVVFGAAVLVQFFGVVVIVFVVYGFFIFFILEFQRDRERARVIRGIRDVVFNYIRCFFFFLIRIGDLDGRVSDLGFQF